MRLCNQSNTHSSTVEWSEEGKRKVSDIFFLHSPNVESFHSFLLVFCFTPSPLLAVMRKVFNFSKNYSKNIFCSLFLYAFVLFAVFHTHFLTQKHIYNRHIPNRASLSGFAWIECKISCSQKRRHIESGKNRSCENDEDEDWGNATKRDWEKRRK